MGALYVLVGMLVLCLIGQCAGFSLKDFLPRQ